MVLSNFGQPDGEWEPESPQLLVTYCLFSVDLVLLFSLNCIYFGKGKAFLATFRACFVVPSDLTAEERQELENIRRRKQELLADIQVGAGPLLTGALLVAPPGALAPRFGPGAGIDSRLFSTRKNGISKWGLLCELHPAGQL